MTVIALWLQQVAFPTAALPPGIKLNDMGVSFLFLGVFVKRNLKNNRYVGRPPEKPHPRSMFDSCSSRCLHHRDAEDVFHVFFCFPDRYCQDL